MKLKRVKRLAGIILVLTLTLVETGIPYVNATEQVNVGEEVVDEVVEKLIDSNQEVESMEEEVYEDVETLNKVGLDIKDIESMEEASSGELVYNLEITDSVTDKISIDTLNNGTIIMNTTEGEIYNELIIQEDGKIFLDGNEVVIEEESKDFEGIEEVTMSTGGLKWYKKSSAPSYLKNATYKGYSQTWRWSNVNCKKPIKSIAFATIVGILTGGCAGGVVGFTSTAFYELVNREPQSKNLSYIDYLANGKSNHRYYKCKRVTYAKKFFKGHSVVTFSYAIMQ